MYDFEHYLKENKVKRQTPDMELAKSLLKDAKNRFILISELNIDKFSKIVFENVYDSFRDLLDSLLTLDGYKSYSHEASIAYLKKYSFEDTILQKLDDFRFKKNSSKYYGKNISKTMTSDIFQFYKKKFFKINKSY